MVEGQDIFREDFINQEKILQQHEKPSEIQKFYEGTTILMTGTTGFVGKILLEKLLRSCPNIKKIYMLLRPKKGKSIEVRFQEELKEPVYERLIREQPNFYEKIKLINADLTQENFLTEEVKQSLIKEVDIVFHCAATVRFDETLRQAININVKSTKSLVCLAREMSNLKAFIYVSTAYSSAPMKNIPEKVIPNKFNYKKITDLLNIADDDLLQRITPQVLEKWANAYVFSKAIAENTIKEFGAGLPIGIFRPSIVISTSKEPLIGWINNYYGPQGVVFGVGIGLLRVLRCDGKQVADMVPVDLVCNAIIAFAWDIGQTKGDNPNFEKISWKDGIKEENPNDQVEPPEEIPVMHYVSSNKNPINWGTFMQYNYEARHGSYSKLMLWHYSFRLTPNIYKYHLERFFYHMIPAVVADGLSILLRKKPMMLKGYKKIHRFTDVITYFCLNSWQFQENTVDSIWNKMSKQDRDLFNFRIEDLDWAHYFSTYLKGLRVYLGKDDMSTLPEGRRKAQRLKLAHYSVLTFLYAIGAYILWWIFSAIFL